MCPQAQKQLQPVEDGSPAHTLALHSWSPELAQNNLVKPPCGHWLQDRGAEKHHAPASGQGPPPLLHSGEEELAPAAQDPGWGQSAAHAAKPLWARRL